MASEREPEGVLDEMNDIGDPEPDEAVVVVA
jgi:hypothetical protein